MKIDEFEKLCLSKSTNRTTLGQDPEQTYLRIYQALKRVAHDTVPLRLHITYPQGQEILRKMDEHSYLRMPKQPTKPEDELDIDSALEDAVALFVMAGLETQRAKIYMGLYYTEIENNNTRLIETDLVMAENEGMSNNSAGEFA